MFKTLLCSTAVLLFLAGCGEKIDPKIVSKYENYINQAIPTAAAAGINIEPFKCVAKGSNIVCDSPNLALKNGQITAKSITITTNEIYKNEDATLPLSAYYEALLKDQKTLKTELKLSGIAFKEAPNLIASATQISPEASELAKTILNNPDTALTLSSATTKKDGLLAYQIIADLNAPKELASKITIAAQQDPATYDKMGATIDTATMKISGLEPLASSDPTQVFDFIQITAADITAQLDTKGALTPLIDIAKGSLAIMKNSSDPSQNELFSAAEQLLLDITKNPVYKLNINATFNTPQLANIDEIGIDAISRLTINGQDLTPLLKSAPMLLK